MNMQRAGITIYIFSGPHMGAELTLHAGKYVIGSDDSCDIILQGSLAARHAVLEVADLVDAAEGVQTKGEAQAHAGLNIQALDEAVLVDGQALPAGMHPVPLGKPWYLGLTCMVWNLPGALQESILPTLMGGAVSPQAKQQADEQNEQSEGDATEDPQHSTPGAGSPEQGTASGEGNPEALTMPSAAVKSRARWWRALGVALLAGLLLALALVVNPSSSDVGEERNTQHPANIFAKAVADAGFNLDVSYDGSSVVVTGLLNSDDERTKLRDIARSMPFAVYLKVGIDSDVLQATKSAFRAQGYFPEVTVQQGVMHVSAYIKDVLLEQGLFLELSKDIPQLPQVQRHIVHEKVLAPTLEAALSSMGLGYLTLRYLPGQVEVSGSLPPEGYAVLDQVFEHVGTLLGVPLRSVLRVEQSADRVQTSTLQATAPVDKGSSLMLNSAPPAFPAPAAGNAADGVPPAQPTLEPLPRPQENAKNAEDLGTEPSMPQNPNGGNLFGMDVVGEQFKTDALSAPKLTDFTGFSSTDAAIALGGLQIAGVTVKPLKFVTTVDGQRFFEGALLPSGYTLESITTNSLTLRKGGQVITHRLRGSNE